MRISGYGLKVNKYKLFYQGETWVVLETDIDYTEEEVKSVEEQYGKLKLVKKDDFEEYWEEGNIADGLGIDLTGLNEYCQMLSELSSSQYQIIVPQSNNLVKFIGQFMVIKFNPDL